VAVIRDQAVAGFMPGDGPGSSSDVRARDRFTFAASDKKADTRANYGGIHEVADRNLLYRPITISFHDPVAANVDTGMVPVASEVARNNRAWSEQFLCVEDFVDKCSTPATCVFRSGDKKSGYKNRPAWYQ
jgi:hypothetical protein